MSRTIEEADDEIIDLEQRIGDLEDELQEAENDRDLYESIVEQIRGIV